MKISKRANDTLKWLVSVLFAAAVVEFCQEVVGDRAGWVGTLFSLFWGGISYAEIKRFLEGGKDA